jgi:preprotein translocase subunit YajC
MTFVQPMALLAQDEAPILAGSPKTTEPAAPGAPAPGQGPAANPFGGSQLLLIVGVMVLILGFSLWGQRKERKRREGMLASVKRHDRVQTIGGVIGSVIEVKSDVIVLKVDESSNTRMTFARSAIQSILKEAPESGAAT